MQSTNDSIPRVGQRISDAMRPVAVSGSPFFEVPSGRFANRSTFALRNTAFVNQTGTNGMRLAPYVLYCAGTYTQRTQALGEILRSIATTLAPRTTGSKYKQFKGVSLHKFDALPSPEKQESYDLSVWPPAIPRKPLLYADNPVKRRRLCRLYLPSCRPTVIQSPLRRCLL
jgi:hypothetical protein